MQWLFVGSCTVCAISMGSRRQQDVAFAPVSGGEVDGIDPEPSARPSERTPLSNGGPREPRGSRSSGKKPGRASRGEVHREAGHSSGGGREHQWWAQTPRPDDV